MQEASESSSSSACTNPASFNRAFQAKLPAPVEYMRVKGEPVAGSRGNTLFSYTIYHGIGSPLPSLGQLSDIFLDRSPNCHRILVKTSDDGWTNWVATMDSKQHQKNPLFPPKDKIVLGSHSSQGLQWMTIPNLNTDRCRHPKRWDISECFQLTLKGQPIPLPLREGGENAIKDGQGASEGVTSTMPDLDASPPLNVEGEQGKSHEVTRSHPISEPVPSVDSEDAEQSQTPHRTIISEELVPPVNATDAAEDPRKRRRSTSLESTVPIDDTSDAPRKRLRTIIPDEPNSAVHVDSALDDSLESHNTITPIPGRSAFVSDVEGGAEVAREYYRPLTPITDVDVDVAPPFEFVPPPTPGSLISDLSSLTSEGDVEEPGRPPLFQQLRNAPNQLMKNRAGYEFPINAKEITWTSGVKTVLPWTQARKKSPVDVAAVKHMARCADATDPNSVIFAPDIESHPINDVVVVITYNKEILHVDSTSLETLNSTACNVEEKNGHGEAAHSKFMAELRKYLAMGYFVIVRGWYPQMQVRWNVESVESYKGCAKQMIEYQDAHLRAKNYDKDDHLQEGIHHRSTLEEFIVMGADPNECGNCLDSPAVRASVPPFITELADCSRALELTRAIGKVEIPLCTDYAMRKKVAAWLRNNKFESVESWYAENPGGDMPDQCLWCYATSAYLEEMEDEVNIDWVQPPGTAVPGKAEMDAFDFDVVDNKTHLFQSLTGGPHTFAWDAWKSQIWDLLTHAGFLTYAHQDAGGYMTYSFIWHGCKIWGILRARLPKKNCTREEWYNVLRDMLQAPPDRDQGDVCDIFNIFLLEGDVLIQPPHSIHQVYTPVNTIASGGHLLAYEVLHLVELARRFDSHYAHISTNADHWSIYRTLCRMAMALTIVWNSRVFYRRPILALAAMVCDPEAYEPDRSGDSKPPGLSRYDLLRLEIQDDAKRARDVVTYILSAYGLDLVAVRTELDQLGKNYRDGTTDEIDLICLKEYSCS